METERDFGGHPCSEFPPEFDNIPQVILPQNPIVYWTFNELNGSVVRDDSGIENHGSFYDESNLTTPDLFDHSETEKDGIAVRFDGNQTIKLEQDVSTYNIRVRSAYVFGLNPRT